MERTPSRNGAGKGSPSSRKRRGRINPLLKYGSGYGDKIRFAHPHFKRRDCPTDRRCREFNLAKNVANELPTLNDECSGEGSLLSPEPLQNGAAPAIRKPQAWEAKHPPPKASNKNQSLLVPPPYRRPCSRRTDFYKGDCGLGLL